MKTNPLFFNRQPVDIQIILNSIRQENPLPENLEKFQRILVENWKQEKEMLLQIIREECIAYMRHASEVFKRFLMGVLVCSEIAPFLRKENQVLFQELIKKEEDAVFRLEILAYYNKTNPSFASLEEVLSHDRDELCQAFILRSIAGGHRYEECKTLLEKYAEARSSFISYIAVLELTRIQAEETPKKILLQFVNELRNGKTFEKKLTHIHQKAGSIQVLHFDEHNSLHIETSFASHLYVPLDFVTLNIQILEATGKNSYQVVIPTLLRSFSPAHAPYLFARLLIGLGFNSLDLHTIQSFSTVQKEILIAFARSSWIKEIPELPELLQAGDFPVDEAGLQRKLEAQTSNTRFPDLQKLYEVNWPEVEHAYGKANDIPQLLKEILSPHKKNRDNAWWTLYGNLFHQGSVYSATVKAVPLLIDFLQYEAVPDKKSILEYLLHLAVGYPEYYIHTGLDIEKEFTQYEEEVPIELLVFREVSKGVPVYLNLFHQNDEAIRAYIPFLLSWFPTYRQKTLPALKYFYEEEENLKVKASILLGISYLSTTHEKRELNAFFQNIFHSQHHNVLQLAAAVALYRADKNQTEEKIMQVLTQYMLTEPEKEDSSPFPWFCEMNQAGFIAGFLEKLSQAQKQKIIPALVKKINGITEVVSFHTILRLVFADIYQKKQAPLHPDELQEWQLDMLRKILDIPVLWQVWNFHTLFTHYGLPSSKKEMEAFLGIKP